FLACLHCLPPSFPTRRSSDLNFIAGHEGYPFYTIGQRRGLGIQLNRAVFVKEIHPETNEVVLASLKSLEKSEMWLKDWNIVDERSEEHTSELQSRFDLVCRRL